PAGWRPFAYWFRAAREIGQRRLYSVADSRAWSASVLQHRERGPAVPFAGKYRRHAIACQTTAWIVRPIPGIREREVPCCSGHTPKEFLQLMEFGLIHQTKLDHPAVNGRLVI